MTISSNEPRKVYNGNGSTVDFTTPVFQVEADLKVYVDEVLQTLTTHYTVTGGSGSTGTVSFVTAPATGTANVVIFCDPAMTQGLDLVENDANPAETREAAFDKLTLLVQRLSERVDRALTLADGDGQTDAVLALPSESDRASNFLAFDVDGEPIAAAGTTETPVSPFMATVLDDADAAAARTTLELGGAHKAATTALATATQYANIATYSYPSGSPAGDDLAAKATLLLTPKEDGGNYKPILIEVNAKQGSSGLDTTNSYIDVIRNAEDAVQHDAFDLTTTAATNGTDIKLHMQSDIAAKYAVQVITEELDPGVSSEYHDGAIWSANNPLTTPAPAASVTSTWQGSGELVPTLGAGWSAGSGCFYRKEGDGKVIVHLYATGSGTATNATTLFTLPTGFRPKLQYHTPLIANSSGWSTPGMMYITPAGAVQIYGVSAASPSDLVALAIFEAA